MATSRTRTRLVDIAARAEVSPMTVASVLTGAGGNRIRVGAKTAERIRAIAEEMGYSPNMAAQQLSGMPSRMIAAVARDWFFAMKNRMLAWLNRAADDSNYRMVTSQTRGRRESLAEYLRECDARGVDGIIYFNYQDDSLWPDARNLLKSKRRVVSLLGDLGIDNAHCVLSDLANGTRQAVEHVYAKGRRKIVQVLEDLDVNVNCQRLEGLKQGFDNCGLKFKKDSVCIATKDWSLTSPEFDNLIEELVIDRKCDAILADNDNGAAAMINAMRRRGIEPGKDVSVVGWGNEPFAPLIVPELTTIQLHMDQLSHHAIQLIVDDMKDDNRQPQKIVIPSDLIIKQSS